MDKYQELYQLAKDTLIEEQARLNRIEEKASKFLSALTVVIGAYGFFGKWIAEKALPPSSFIEWALLILAAITLFSLAYSWAKVFHVLQTHPLKKLPLNESIFKFFQEKSLPTIYYGMAKGIQNALLANRQIGDRKSHELSRGFHSIIFSGCLILVLSVVLAFHAWNENNQQPSISNQYSKNRSTTMSSQQTVQEKPKPTSTPETGPTVQPETEPDTEVNPPDFDTVFEGVDPLNLPTGIHKKEEANKKP